MTDGRIHKVDRLALLSVSGKVNAHFFGRMVQVSSTGSVLAHKFVRMVHLTSGSATQVTVEGLVRMVLLSLPRSGRSQSLM